MLKNFKFSDEDEKDIREMAEKLTVKFPDCKPNNLYLLAIETLWREKWLPAGRKPDTKKPEKKGLFD
jgi:hypothetical protein